LWNPFSGWDTSNGAVTMSDDKKLSDIVAKKPAGKKQMIVNAASVICNCFTINLFPAPVPAGLP
jgi:hypothetical protein